MRYKVIIKPGEDDWYVAECPAIPGCVSQGKTIKETLENVRDAIVECLDVLNKRAERYILKHKKDMLREVTI